MYGTKIIALGTVHHSADFPQLKQSDHDQFLRTACLSISLHVQ